MSQTPFRSLWKWTDVLFICGATIVLVMLGLDAINSVANLAFEAGLAQSVPILANILISTLEVGAILVPVYLIGLHRRHLNWRDIGVRPTNRIWLRVALVVGAAAFFISGYVAATTSRMMVTPSAAAPGNIFIPGAWSWLGLGALLSLDGLAIPIAEEILFRGVIYNWLRGRWGVLGSVLVSSLVFGAAHQDVSIGASAFTLGLFSALVYEASHSLYPSIFIHAFNNTFKLAVVYGLLVSGMKI